jgi:hypothetical protein
MKMFDKEINKAEAYYGDIMYEVAMSEVNGDDEKALERLDEGFDKETIKSCLFDALMTAGITNNLEKIVTHWQKEHM